MVDTPLSAEQLASPKIAFSIIRPLEDDYYNLNSPAILYALMVNRLHFLKTQTHTLSLHSVNATRASLCEILASCILRRIDDEPPDPAWEDIKGQALLRIARYLVRSFSPFQGAPLHVIPPQFQLSEVKQLKVGRVHDSSSGSAQEGHTSALELSLVSEAKGFIRVSCTGNSFPDVLAKMRACRDCGMSETRRRHLYGTDCVLCKCLSSPLA